MTARLWSPQEEKSVSALGTVEVGQFGVIDDKASRTEIITEVASNKRSPVITFFIEYIICTEIHQHIAKGNGRLESEIKWLCDI